jgi:hypothetical protein
MGIENLKATQLLKKKKEVLIIIIKHKVQPILIKLNQTKEQMMK